ncbi:MAG: hypothetical protein V5B78_03845 [Desulfohalobiaceae bacterium]
MIVIPNEDPVFEELNTYYLDLNRMLEHFSGSIGSGTVHVQSRESEGAIFFESDATLSATFQTPSGELVGQNAVEEMVKQSRQSHYTVNIYRIEQTDIHYWANIPFATPIYQDLSSEFTDLQGLIKKLQEESLTGYILATLDKDQARLFFQGGELIGAAYSWTNDELNRTPQKLDEIFSWIQENKALFNVYRIMPANEGPSEDEVEVTAEEAVEADDIYAMLEELLEKIEKAVSNSRSIRDEFSTLLRRKFLEKANDYPFLDPFAAEIEYDNGKINNYSKVDENEIVKGVVESVKEIVGENDLEKSVRADLDIWRAHHSSYLSELPVEI